MEYNFSPIEYWLIFGCAAVLFEIFFISGLGLLFVGMGALTVAGVISLNSTTLPYEYPLFAAFSFAWFGILWQPIKKYLQYKSTKNHSSDLIDQIVEVTGLSLSSEIKLGQVKWSGTILNARLDHTIKDEQPVGTLLRVKEVDGSIVICTKI